MAEKPHSFNDGVVAAFIGAIAATACKLDRVYGPQNQTKLNDHFLSECRHMISRLVSGETPLEQEDIDALWKMFALQREVRVMGQEEN